MFCSGDDCVDLIMLQLVSLFTLESNWDPLGLKVCVNEWDFLVLCMCVYFMCVSLCLFLYFFF